MCKVIVYCLLHTAVENTTVIVLFSIRRLCAFQWCLCVSLILALTCDSLQSGGFPSVLMTVGAERLCAHLPNVPIKEWFCHTAAL